MSKSIPLKTLFQNREANGETQWRLSLLVDTETLRKLIEKLETDPRAPAVLRAEMPAENFEIVLEVHQDEPKAPLSRLQYFKHTTEAGWNTTHVTLIRDGDHPK